MANELKLHINTLIPKLKDKKVYLALSGGVDSMVLLYLLQNTNLNLTALHCNFKLRGADSDIDEEFVRNYCTSNDISFQSTHFDTANISKKNNETIQVSARNLRYNWFDSFLMEDSQSILLTAHHANDSSETFFINLLRGTGITGLSGIKSERPQLLRPLLQFSKAHLKSFAALNKIPFREDKSNADIKYTRNRIRHELLPLMESMTSNFEGKLQVLMKDLGEIDSFLLSYSAKLSDNIVSIKTNEHTIEIKALQNLPKPILLRLFSQYNIQRLHLEELIKLMDAKTGSIFQNDSHIFLKNREKILIKALSTHTFISEVINTLPFRKQIGNHLFTFTLVENNNIQFDSNIAFIDYGLVSNHLTITNKHSGLRIQPLGMKGSKLISDILTEAKLSRFEKEEQLIILSGKEVVWLAGRTISQKFSISDNTKKVLKIEMLE